MSDDFATYDDVYGPGGMADDRDDTYDPEFRDPDGYCEHGRYVGGCGADLMCEWCESGISATEAKRIVTAERTRAIREKANRAARLLNDLLKIPECGGILAAEMSERSSNVSNPESRYGRTGWDMRR